MEINRRTAMLAATAATAMGMPARASADDEAYWARIAALYPVSRKVIQLENGYWGSMATPVLVAHRANLDRLNSENSWFARRAMVRDQKIVLERAAQAMGVLPEEIGLCRNAAEGLSALISQFRDVGPGDRILYSDTDYEAMQGAMVSLARSRGAEAVKINLPRVISYDNAIAAYAEAIAAAPRLKLVLLTHMSHRAGLVLPVASIVPLAKARGAQVIVHSAIHPVMGPDGGTGFPAPIYHRQSTATDLGAMAQRSGAQHLMLTHLIPPLEADRQGPYRLPKGAITAADYETAVRAGGFAGGLTVGGDLSSVRLPVRR
jgi:hypothetical protein